MTKNFRHLERIVRGYSNHRRIQILRLLDRRPEIDLTTLAAECGTRLKTVAEHMRRLAAAGLILKRLKGRRLLHVLSKRGRDILEFLRRLE